MERGGEFIAPEDHAVLGLVAELGLAVVPHGFSFDRRPTPLHAAPSDTELDAVAAWARTFVEPLTEDVAALEALPPEEQWDPAAVSALRRLETSMTVPLAEVSARRTFTGRFERYDPAVRVRGGNQAIALELARRLEGRVRLQSPVVGVRCSATTAVVTVQGGQTYDAVAVILAVPLPLLLDLDLDPGLPDGVRAAAGRTRFGDAMKLHVPLAVPPSPARMAAPASRWWCWTSQATADSPQAAPVLSCFAGGAAAIETITKEAALALRPDVVASPEAPLVTHWGAERWTRGSYTAPGVGLTSADDHAWTQPLQRIVLAGEHTAGERAATMNGAAASGARAARTALELCRPHGVPGRSR